MQESFLFWVMNPCVNPVTLQFRKDG